MCSLSLIPFFLFFFAFILLIPTLLQMFWFQMWRSFMTQIIIQPQTPTPLSCSKHWPCDVRPLLWADLSTLWICDKFDQVSFKYNPTGGWGSARDPGHYSSPTWALVPSALLHPPQHLLPPLQYVRHFGSLWFTQRSTTPPDPQSIEVTCVI